MLHELAGGTAEHPLQHVGGELLLGGLGGIRRGVNVRALFFGAFALLVLLPIGIVLAVVGLPIVGIIGILALPVLLVMFLVGLPLLIVIAGVTALLGATFGIVMAFFSLGVVVLKVAFIVLVPVLIIGLLTRRVFEPTRSMRV